MREIKRIDPSEIDRYTEIYLNAYPAFKSFDEECRARYRQKTLDEMALDDDVDFMGLYEDDELIAIMKVVHFSMNLFGEMKPACGLMSLGVHPLHKKKHCALDMVKGFERISLESGALVYALLPFNMEFYQNMGYGPGSKMDEYHIPTAYLPDGPFSRYDMRILYPEDVPEMLSCYSRWATLNHGAMDKFSEEKRIMEKDASALRLGCYEGGELKGYISYHFAPHNDTNYTLNTLVVDELICTEGDVLRALLGFLKRQGDLAQDVVIRTGEEDFYHILKNSQSTSGNYINYGYLETNVSAVGNMYKLGNPEVFVRETSHRRFLPVDMTASLGYREALSGEEKELLIEFKDGRWTIPVEPGSSDAPAAADVTVTGLSQGQLSSLLMGACKLSSLIRLGEVKASQGEKAEILSGLLAAGQKPFSNNDY